jgi:hypothetical protein
LGGCILISAVGEIPGDLYQETDIVETDEYKPFTKKLTVYGITLIGRDDISDEFMRKVAKTIKEMFPQGGSIDAALQEEVLRNLYRYRAVIPFFRGEDHELAPLEEADWDRTCSQNSICDCIFKEPGPGQVNEVVEHILHFVTDVGLHYTFGDEWGISKTSKVYQAMQEAIDKGYYDVNQYGDDEGEEKLRVLIQEFAYWVIFTAWDLLEPYGPQAEWTGINNPTDLQEKLPLSYQLFRETIPKVMVSPSLSTLNEFTKNSSNTRSRRVFTKQVEVLGIHVLATADSSDEIVLHVANILAEYLDNDEDGVPDNQKVMDALIRGKAVYRHSDDDEVHPNGAAKGLFDASLEEVLHLITDQGYGVAYPEVFGRVPGTEISNLLDKARGGRLMKVPEQYPDDAWFTYDDETCDYDCQNSEYIYWVLTSILGAQDYPGRLEQIQREWRLNTKEKVKQGDPVAYALFTDPKYKFPTVLPDGKYKAKTFTIQKYP